MLDSRASGRAAFFPSCNVAFPTEPFRDIGGFDVSFRRCAGEDRELCDRWQYRGYRMIHAPEAVVYHSHRLTAKTFVLQQFHYGRAAYSYHVLRARRRQEQVKLEPLVFYVNILIYPFGQLPLTKAIRVCALIFAAQAVNALGFFWELATTKKRGPNPPNRPK